MDNVEEVDMSLEISQIPKAAARELLAGIAPVADSGEVSWSEFFSAPSEQRAELHQGEQHWSASALLGGERGPELAQLIGDWLAQAGDQLPEARLRARFTHQQSELWIEHAVAEAGQAVEHHRLDQHDPSRSGLAELHRALRQWISGQPAETRLTLRSQ